MLSSLFWEDMVGRGEDNNNKVEHVFLFKVGSFILHDRYYYPMYTHIPVS